MVDRMDLFPNASSVGWLIYRAGVAAGFKFRHWNLDPVDSDAIEGMPEIIPQLYGECRDGSVKVSAFNDSSVEVIFEAHSPYGGFNEIVLTVPEGQFYRARWEYMGSDATVLQSNPHMKNMMSMLNRLAHQGPAYSLMCGPDNQVSDEAREDLRRLIF